MSIKYSSLNKTFSLLVHMGIFWYAVLAWYLIALGFLSLNPWVLPTATDDILSPDKLKHAFAYGGLAIVVYFCLIKSHYGYFNNAKRAWLAAILISALIGILLEIAQSLFTYNRSGSIEDVVANTIGVVLGYIGYNSAKYISDKLVQRS